MVKELLVHSFFPGVLFRALESEGYSETLLLSCCGLKRGDFEDSKGIITLSQHQRFILNAIDVTNDAHLGLKLGGALNVTNLGLLGYGAISCRNLSEALSLITEFFEIRTPLLSLKLKNSTKRCRIEITEHFVDARLHYFMQLATISGVVKLIRYLMQSALVETNRFEASLTMSVQNSFSASQNKPEIPGVNFLFEQKVAGISFPKSWLATSLPMADPQTAAYVSGLCKNELVRNQVRIGWVHKVLAILTSTEGKLPGVAQCAAQLNISGRTLRRKLEQENSSFHILTEQVLFERAKTLLLERHCSLQETAIELGFNDFSNFGRAFKRWSGESPGKYRQRNITN